MMHRKASLSLSVNAIVVLILAIVMLGLSLGFIKTIFGKAGIALDTAIGIEPEPSAANLGDPVTLSKGKMVFEIGKSGIIKISMYNAGAAITTVPIVPTVTCVPGTFEKVGAIPGVKWDANSPQTFAVGIKYTGQTPDTGVCTVTATVGKERRAEFAVEAVLAK